MIVVNISFPCHAERRQGLVMSLVHGLPCGCLHLCLQLAGGIAGSSLECAGQGGELAVYGACHTGVAGVVRMQAVSVGA